MSSLHRTASPSQSINIRQPHTTPLPHRACHQPLDIKARIPNLIVQGDLVLVKDGEPKFERRLIASDVEEKRLLPHKAARVANNVYAEDLPKRKTTKGRLPPGRTRYSEH